MADPFAILASSRVDVPGALAAYTNARQSRMQELMFERQMRKDQQEADRDVKIKGIYARLTVPTQTKGGDPASGGTAPANGSAGVASAPTTLVDPAQLPPRTDGLTINQDALRELYAIDAPQAMKIQEAVYNLDKDKLEQMQANAGTLASIAYGLKKDYKTPEERYAALQTWAPALKGMGVDTSTIRPEQLADGAIDGYIYQAQKVGDLFTQDKPQIISQSPGEVTQAYDPRTGQLSEVGRSPIPRVIIGADQQPYVLDTAPAGKPAITAPRRPSTAVGNAPATAVEYLRAHPDTAEKFDAMYGVGTSRKILGGAPSQGGATFPAR